MKQEYMKLCDLFGENPIDIELVKNENGEVLKATGKQFTYFNRELIHKSKNKNKILIAQLQCGDLWDSGGTKV